MQTLGLHHVSVLSGLPRPNVYFYAEVLGLRLVKRTVNFDEPRTYHLYYGDGLGRPGTLMTTFPLPAARVGCVGAGMAAATAFTVGEGGVDFWMGRFADLGLDFEAPVERFGERVLAFTDPDALPLEIVERAGAPGEGWAGGPVPPEHALRSLDAVTLALADPEPTAAVVRDLLGYAEAGQEGERLRFRAPGDRAAVLDLVPSDRKTCGGIGTVHHVAFRAADDAELAAWTERLRAAGLRVTEVRERHYFRSIYFREPGGVLFEVATDGPGFATDEAPEALGTALRLPPWLEPRRAELEAVLPPLDAVPA